MPYDKGLAGSVVVFAVGAVLGFVVQLGGADGNRVGAVLMVAGALGFVVSLVASAAWTGSRRARRATVEVDERASY